MGYTENAMISVLQKAEKEMRSGKSMFDLQIALEGVDEFDCYQIAIREQYIITSFEDRLRTLTYRGLIELHRLTERKSEKKREIEHRTREQLKVNLDIGAFTLSLVSIAFSACTLWIIALDRYRPSMVEQPIRVMGAIEVLPYQTPTAQNGDKDTETCEPDTEASDSSADIHES